MQLGQWERAHRNTSWIKIQKKDKIKWQRYNTKKTVLYHMTHPNTTLSSFTHSFADSEPHWLTDTRIHSSIIGCNKKSLILRNSYCLLLVSKFHYQQRPKKYNNPASLFDWIEQKLLYVNTYKKDYVHSINKCNYQYLICFFKVHGDIKTDTIQTTVII